MQQQKKQQMQLTRSLSAGSTPQDAISIPDHLNVPRRRDSGNWSGDRNSASSSSSTTMDNPYLYIVNKMQRNSGVPKSPTSKSGELSSSSSGHYDAGYDSYSLSSTDSLPLQQGLKHNLQVRVTLNNIVILVDIILVAKAMDLAIVDINRVIENSATRDITVLWKRLFPCGGCCSKDGTIDKMIFGEKLYQKSFILLLNNIVFFIIAYYYRCIFDKLSVLSRFFFKF